MQIPTSSLTMLRLPALLFATLGLWGSAMFDDSARQPVRAAVDPTAELPRVFLKTEMPLGPAKGHRLIPVAEGANLQAVLDQAQPGDVIELARGALFVGNFVLPAKGGSDWIVIRPANVTQLPAQGERMTPAVARRLNLPRLVSPNSSPVIRSAPRSHHFRLVGLDLGVLANQAQSWGVVILASTDTSTSAADLPHDITLDRLYIHGGDALSLRRCVALNSASTAIIDSWLSNCHDRDSDSQAIAGWAGPGPFKIVNNHLEGATENVTFGGTDPVVRGLVPSDIEFRRNHVVKPRFWKNLWLAKNLIELKNAQRMLIEGNVFENNWAHGQNGEAFVFWSVNQSGKCPWCVTQDITMRLNVIRNVGAVGVMAGEAAWQPAIPSRRFVFTDNIITGINVPPFDGNGRGFALYRDVSIVLISHNTVMSPTNSAVVFGPTGAVIRGLVFRDNIIDGGQYGIIGDGLAGMQALRTYAPDAVLKSNVIIVPDGGKGFTSDNLLPLTAAAIRFTDLASGDVTLPAGSPLKKHASDGLDTGADVAAVRRATDGVRDPD